MKQKVKKILNSCLIGIGLMAPVAAISASFVTSCSSSNGDNNNQNNLPNNNQNNNQDSTSVDGTSTAPVNGVKPSPGKKLINFESNLLDQPDNSVGQYALNDDHNNYIYIQKEKQLLDIYNEIENNNIDWWDEENNQPIKYQLSITLNSDLYIGFSQYGDISMNFDWNTNFFKQAGNDQTGVTNISFPFYVNSETYDPNSNIPPLSAQYLTFDLNNQWFPMNCTDETNFQTWYSNPMVKINDLPTWHCMHIEPQMRDWVNIFEETDDGRGVSVLTNSIDIDKQNDRIYLSFNGAGIGWFDLGGNLGQLQNYGIVTADKSTFTNKDPKLNKIYITNSLAQECGNEFYIFPTESFWYRYIFKNNSSPNIGTFSIKPIK